MGSQIVLTENELVCNNKFRFLHYASKEEKDKAPKSYRRLRCGIFECQMCDNHTVFIAPISRLIRGEIRHCPKCANLSRSKKTLQHLYKKGDYIGNSGNLIYIEEAGRDLQKCRLVTVQDITDGIVFTTRLSHILSGRTKSSPYQVEIERERRLAECRQHINLSKVYQVGDILGPDKNMLFVEEIEPIIDNDGHKRRAGIFRNIYTGKEVRTRLKNITDGMNRGLDSNSLGETKISFLLTNLSIVFIPEYTFPDCVNPKTGYKLRFDFYLPDYNCCIEYDGEQHFQFHYVGWNTEDSYIDLKYRDGIKNNYCDANNIRLIRIPYYDYNKLTEDYILHLIQDLDV